MKDGDVDRNQDFGIWVVQEREDYMTVLGYLVLKWLKHDLKACGSVRNVWWEVEGRRPKTEREREVNTGFQRYLHRDNEYQMNLIGRLGYFMKNPHVNFIKSNIIKYIKPYGGKHAPIWFVIWQRQKEPPRKATYTLWFVSGI